MWLWRPGRLNFRSTTGPGEVETLPLQGTYQNPGQSSGLRSSLGQTYLLVLESLLQRWGGGGHSPWICRYWWQPHLGKFYDVNTASGRWPLGSSDPRPSPTQKLKMPVRRHLMPNNWLGTQPQSPEDRMSKTSWALSHLSTSPRRDCMTEGQDPALPSMGGHQVCPPESLH